MPTIPLYNKGLGPSVKLATGQLSPRASSAAFEAPGRALAGLGQQVSEVAFRFGQAEKNLETNRVATEYELKAGQDGENYRIGLTETDTTKAANGLKTIEDRMLNEIKGLDLTPSQKAAVEQRTRRKFASEYTNVKSKAFTNHLRVTSATTNNSLEALQTEIAFAAANNETTFNEFGDEVPLAAALTEQGLQTIQDGMVNGLSLNYTPSSFKEGVINQYVKGLTADPEALTVNSYENARRMVKDAASDKDISPAAAAQQLSFLDAARDKSIVANTEKLSGQIFQSGLDADEFESAMKQLPNPDANEIVIKRGEQELVFDISQLPADVRANVANSFRLKRNTALTEEQSEMLESATVGLQGKSLSSLQSLKQQAQSLTGIAEGMELSTANALESQIDAEIRERMPRAQQNVDTNLSAAKTTIVETGGDMEAVQPYIDEAVAQAQSLGPEGAVMSDGIQDSTMAIMEAAGIYRTVKTSNDAAIQQARLDLIQRRNDETDARKKNVLTEAISTFESMIAKRKEAITADPVAFLNAENRRDLQDQSADPLTASELIQRQVAMGIPPQNARLLSNADVTSFQTQFNALEDNYIAKSEFANKFLADKSNGNVDDANRMYRNLAESGVLSLVDEIVINNPGNAKMFAVNAGNTADSLKSYKQNFTDTERRELRALVRNKNTEYSTSIVGGDVGGIVSRGATSNRMQHVGQMNEAIANTALYYMMQDGSLSQEDAVERAIDTVIDSQFAFTSVNGKSIRFKKGMEPQAEIMGQILQSNLSNGVAQLTNMIAVPRGQYGESQEVRAAEYASNIAERGYWVTTSDNAGVFLVDPDGNMVPRKRDPNEPIGGPQSQFIYVKYEDLMGTAGDILRLQAEMPAIGTSRPEFMRRIEQLTEARVF
jgi:hypothetical protein